VLSVQALDGTILPLTDDNSVSVNLGFSFPFQGQTYSSVFVNANGNLTFGTGNGDFSETVAEFLAGPPRIAPLWDDLFPAAGLVVATPEPGAVTIHYVSVPAFFSERANYFSVRLEHGGRIALSHAGTLAQAGLVGVTKGGGAPDSGPVDLSRLSGTTRVADAIYEVFTLSAPFDLPFRKLRFN
jgi:hypothetical protein